MLNTHSMCVLHCICSSLSLFCCMNTTHRYCIIIPSLPSLFPFFPSPLSLASSLHPLSFPPSSISPSFFSFHASFFILPPFSFHLPSSPLLTNLIKERTEFARASTRVQSSPAMSRLGYVKRELTTDLEHDKICHSFLR